MSSLMGALMLLPAAVFSLAASGSITVENLHDRLTYNGRVEFRILADPGFEYDSFLDGREISEEAWIQAGPGFHELQVNRQNAGGVVDQKTYRFVVLDPQRGDPEWGLTPWTPPPLIESSDAELAGGRLNVVMPSSMPSGFPIPAVYRVEDESGRRLPVNRRVAVNENLIESTNLRRGVGHTFLKGADGSQSADFRFQTGPLFIENRVVLEESPEWQAVSGTLEGEVVWTENARIQITEDLTIAADAVLRVEAGVVVALAGGVEILLEGRLTMAGRRESPIVWMPMDPESPWGGIVLWSAPAAMDAEFSIFTGSGGNLTWFPENRVHGTHRPEQAAVFLGEGVVASFHECHFISNAGQALHGEDAILNAVRCSVQRCQTVGEFNGGEVNLTDCELIEFPVASDDYVDGDNDAIYLTRGKHRLTRCLIGWCKDDGIDAGADDPGEVVVEECWFEACFHEGMALSGTDKIVRVTDSVFLNNGQGVEAGYLSPQVAVENSLLTGNLVGARFGDNYNRAHDGLLQVTDSILIHNQRDVWGLDRSLWAENKPRMTIEGNRLSGQVDEYGANDIWNPEVDGPRLRDFRNGASAEVGVGFTRGAMFYFGETGSVPIGIGLSVFSPETVSAALEVVRSRGFEEGVHFELSANKIEFLPGQTLRTVELRMVGAAAPADAELTLALADSVNGRISPYQATFRIITVEAANRPVRLDVRRVEQSVYLSFPAVPGQSYRIDRLNLDEPGSEWTVRQTAPPGARLRNVVLPLNWAGDPASALYRVATEPFAF